MDIMIYMTVFNIYSNNPGTGFFFFLKNFLDFFFLILSYSIFFREIILMVLL